MFGAGGSVGSAVANEFAIEGAEIFLAGKSKARLDEVARQIKEAGGATHVAMVDALDFAAVDRCVDDIEQKSGRISKVVLAFQVTFTHHDGFHEIPRKLPQRN